MSWIQSKLDGSRPANGNRDCPLAPAPARAHTHTYTHMHTVDSGSAATFADMSALPIRVAELGNLCLVSSPTIMLSLAAPRKAMSKQDVH